MAEDNQWAPGRLFKKKVTVPCRLCGLPTMMLGTKCCDSCRELEHRIEAQPFLANKILERLKTIHKTDFKS